MITGYIITKLYTVTSKYRMTMAFIKFGIKESGVELAAKAFLACPINATEPKTNFPMVFQDNPITETSFISPFYVSLIRVASIHMLDRLPMML